MEKKKAVNQLVQHHYPRDTPSSPTEVELQIPFEMDRLEKNIDVLANWIADLEGKLSPIISTIPQLDCDSNKDEALCTLAEKLRGFNRRVTANISRIQATMMGLQI
jgi:hypothetical protein